MRAIVAESAQGVIGVILGRPFAEQALRRSVATGAGKLFITAHYSSLTRGRILKYFEPAYPDSYLAGEANVFASKDLVKPLGNSAYLDLESGELFSLGRAAVHGERGLVKDLDAAFAEKYILREFVEDSAGKWIARNVGIPFLTDFGFQLAADWSNPRLTGWQKVGRAGVSGFVGVVGGGIVYVTVSILIGATPPGELLLIGGVILGVLVENPFSRYINERVFPEKPLNLRPLP